MLAYTLDQLLTERAVVERNAAVGDAYGGTETPNWQYHTTARCRVTWSRSGGIRSANRTYVTAAREASLEEGTIMMPLGVDVTELDRVVRVETFNPEIQAWEPYITGDIAITAVVVQEDHLELNISRPHLGA